MNNLHNILNLYGIKKLAMQYVLPGAQKLITTGVQAAAPAIEQAVVGAGKNVLKGVAQRAGNTLIPAAETLLSKTVPTAAESMVPKAVVSTLPGVAETAATQVAGNVAKKQPVGALRQFFSSMDPRRIYRGLKRDYTRAPIRSLGRDLAQGYAGYKLGLPIGVAGNLGFLGRMVTNPPEAQGAASALTEVDRQLADYEAQLANLPTMARLGLAFNMATDPRFGSNVVGQQRSALQQQISKLTGKPYNPQQGR